MEMVCENVILCRARKIVIIYRIFIGTIYIQNIGMASLPTALMYQFGGDGILHSEYEHIFFMYLVRMFLFFKNNNIALKTWEWFHFYSPNFFRSAGVKF